MDRALDATAARQFLRDNIALHLGAIAYLDSRGVYFSLHVTKNPQLPLANNLTDNRKSRTDGGSRFWRRRVPNSGAFDLLRRGPVTIGVCRIAFGFCEHVALPTLVFADGSSNCLGDVVETMETAAKMTEQFATGRFCFPLRDRRC